MHFNIQLLCGNYEFKRVSANSTISVRNDSSPDKSGGNYCRRLCLSKNDGQFYDLTPVDNMAGRHNGEWKVSQIV